MFLWPEKERISRSKYRTRAVRTSTIGIFSRGVSHEKATSSPGMILVLCSSRQLESVCVEKKSPERKRQHVSLRWKVEKILLRCDQ